LQPFAMLLKSHKKFTEAEEEVREEEEEEEEE
jgi:hypothetical protein